MKMNTDLILRLIFMHYHKKNFSKIFELCYIHGNDLDVARLCDRISAIRLYYAYFSIISIFIIIILIMRYK
jgi:hypothetical protein